MPGAEHAETSAIPGDARPPRPACAAPPPSTTGEPPGEVAHPPLPAASETIGATLTPGGEPRASALRVAHMLRKCDPCEWGGAETAIEQLLDASRTSGALA